MTDRGTSDPAVSDRELARRIEAHYRQSGGRREPERVRYHEAVVVLNAMRQEVGLPRARLPRLWPRSMFGALARVDREVAARLAGASRNGHSKPKRRRLKGA